jgi:hypothetical protein
MEVNDTKYPLKLTELWYNILTKGQYKDYVQNQII